MSAEMNEARAAKLQNRFDIRRIIGGLFLVYGVVLTVVGIVGSHADKTKAAGINVNLWTGLAMIVVGVLMAVWALWRPVVPVPSAQSNRPAADGETSSPPSTSTPGGSSAST